MLKHHPCFSKLSLRKGPRPHRLNSLRPDASAYRSNGFNMQHSLPALPSLCVSLLTPLQNAIALNCRIRESVTGFSGTRGAYPSPLWFFLILFYEEGEAGGHDRIQLLANLSVHSSFYLELGLYLFDNLEQLDCSRTPTPVLKCLLLQHIA